mmetsp:Transcript_10981/g.12056  ORF Transcript_10981/g.12056 Transcript_10981/m.12056 type:complete len:612 (+) Transcript_10981:53-1888(+)
MSKMNPQLLPTQVEWLDPPKTENDKYYAQKTFTFEFEDFLQGEDLQRTARVFFRGHKWNIKVVLNETHMGVFLELHNSSKQLKVITDFAVTMVNDKQSSKSKTAELVSDFGVDYSNCCGWEKFAEREALTKDPNILKNKRLTLRLHMKSARTIFYHSLDNVFMWENTFAPSKEFSFFDTKWFLKFYPCGTGKGKNTHLSVFLASKGTDRVFKPKLSYRVTLIDQEDPSRNIHKTIGEYGHEFRPDSDWGWKEFISIDELNRKDRGFLKNQRLCGQVEIFYATAVFEFKIEKFTIWGERYVEEVFDYHGIKWVLSVYPEGHGDEKDKALSIYLELANFQRKDFKSLVRYRVVVVDQEDMNHNMEVVDDRLAGSDSGSWGWENFMKLEELKHADRSYLKDNKLIVKMEVYHTDTMFDTVECIVRKGGDNAVYALRKRVRKFENKRRNTEKKLTDANSELEELRGETRKLRKRLKTLRDLPTRFSNIQSALTALQATISTTDMSDIAELLDGSMDEPKVVDAEMPDVVPENNFTDQASPAIKPQLTEKSIKDVLRDIIESVGNANISRLGEQFKARTGTSVKNALKALELQANLRQFLISNAEFHVQDMTVKMK